MPPGSLSGPPCGQAGENRPRRQRFAWKTELDSYHLAVTPFYTGTMVLNSIILRQRRRATGSGRIAFRTVTQSSVKSGPNSSPVPNSSGSVPPNGGGGFASLLALQRMSHIQILFLRCPYGETHSITYAQFRFADVGCRISPAPSMALVSCHDFCAQSGGRPPARSPKRAKQR